MGFKRIDKSGFEQKPVSERISGMKDNIKHSKCVEFQLL